MKVGRGLYVSLRVGLTLALLSVLAWLLVFLLPPVSDSEFAELESQRTAELARRSVHEFTFGDHQPLILAARRIGPFGHPGFALLSLATFPAVMAATRQAAPPLGFDLPLAKQESWLAFILVLLYSASMWFALGVTSTGALVGLRRLLRRGSRAAAGAG
jgi:hypothetical protein